MTLYPHALPFRTRTIAEIAKGKLHAYGIENIPRYPHATGSLRYLYRNRLRYESAEPLHLKSEADMKKEIKTMEERLELAKKELQRKEKQKQDDLETGGAEIG